MSTPNPTNHHGLVSTPSLDEFEASLQLPPNHPPIAPVKSSQDKRHYRVITLPNQLTALLISDPDTDKSAASLDVNIGSFAEPSHALGLAHFLEHLLFMGTSKYPDEQSYSLAINNYGGSQNAYTTREHTNYIFDVTKDHLEEVLDRFAQFFVSPLCLRSAVDRELTAVNNEHERNIQSDVWRVAQLADSACNPAHPISRFSTGNFLTLRDQPKEAGLDIREEVLKFYRATYSANLMKLCVCGKEELDTLQKWVENSFADVPNHQLPRPDFRSIPLALPEHRSTLTRIVPVKNHRSLELEWMLPPTHHLYQTNPARLLTHVIAHEDEGSLAHILKARGLVNELSSGPFEQNSSYSLARIDMELTEKGLEQVEDTILPLTFAFLHMLRRSLEQQRSYWEETIYPEVRAVADMEFRFSEKIDPIWFCEDLAARLSSVPAEHVLSHELLRGYNHEQLVELADMLVDVGNLRVRMLAPEFKSLPNLQKETWYGTEHTVERLSPALIASLSNPASITDPDAASFHLPRPNPFVATDFTLKHGQVREEVEKSKISKQTPKKLLCGCKGQKEGIVEEDSLVPAAQPADLYFQPDHQFGLPKASVTICLTTSFAHQSPTNWTLSALWQDLVDDLLSSENHLASEAGLNSWCWPTDKGLMIRFSGYDHKLRQLIETVLPKMKGMKVAGERESQFDRLKEAYRRKLTQYSKESPLRHARDDSNLLRSDVVWSCEDQLATFDRLTAHDVDEFFKAWLMQAKIVVLCNGNLTEEEARDITSSVQSIFQPAPLLTSQQPSQRCIALSPSHVYLRQRHTKNPQETNSACLNVYQIGLQTDELDAHTQLLSHILGDAVFDQLRTRETLGYLVHCHHNVLARVLHFNVAVQSSDADASYLNYRIEAFLTWFRHTRLEELIKETPDFLEKNKTAVQDNLLEKEKNIGEEHSRLWREIEKKRFEWDRQERIAKEVGKVTLESLQAFYDRYLLPTSSERRKVSHQYFSPDHKLPERVERETQEMVEYANQKVVIKKKEGAEKKEGEATAAAAPATPAEDKKEDDKKEEVYLPPVPLDPRPIRYIDDLIEFKQTFPMHPAGL